MRKQETKKKKPFSHRYVLRGQALLSYFMVLLVRLVRLSNIYYCFILTFWLVRREIIWTGNNPKFEPCHVHSGLCPTGALGQYHNVLCPEWLSADIIKYELIEHNLSHTTHLCCEVENMPSKNFRNKCYISFQFSITFRWSDEGKKKFHQKFIKLKTVRCTGKNNQPLGPFLGCI